MKQEYPKLTAAIMEGFVASCLAKDYDEATSIPDCHRDIWDMFCSDFPCVAAALPRGHAKTTSGTQAFSLASVLFRNRKYVIIVADTETQAAQFLGDIKKAIGDNDDVKMSFGDIKFIKDSTTDIICEFEDGEQFRIQAKGAGQKLRGLKWDNLRPDLICIDDLENDEDVRNPESREKLRRWFYGALLPCRSRKGIVRYVGTILHADSLLENILTKYKLKYVTDLKSISRDKRNPWLTARYKAHNSDYTKILWPDRYPKDYWVQTREDFRRDGLGDVYNQEYLNLPIDETTAFFRKSDFIGMQEDDYPKHKKMYIGIDLALSSTQTSDYSAFVVSGIDDIGCMHIVDVIRERLDSQDIVATMISLQKKYHPEFMSVGNDMISKSIGPFLREEMFKKGVFINLLTMPQTQDKQMRARSIQARIRSNGVKFDKNATWYDMFEEEMTTFPRAKHDDMVDAIAHIGMALDSIIPAETLEELEELEWQEEYGSDNDPIALGANPICGY